MTNLIREAINAFGAQFYRTRPIKSDSEMFLDLHAHLPRYFRTIDDHLAALSQDLDGYAVTSYGHWADKFTADYEGYVSAIRNVSFDYVIEDKGVLAVVTDKKTGRKRIVFKGQEIDRTKQLLDITGIGIEARLDNTADESHPEDFPDARRVADRIRKQGGLAFLEHFCAIDTGLSRVITGFKKKLPWAVEPYANPVKKQALFGVFPHVDAVEVFNGVCTLYMVAQNVHSDRLAREYEGNTGKPLVRLAGTDTHCDPLNIGTAGVIIPKLDLTLEGPEIIEQLKDNLRQARLVRGYPTMTSFAVQMVKGIRDGTSSMSDAVKRIGKLHETLRL